MANMDLQLKDNNILDFINETREGKYTELKPDLTHITYARIDIQESRVENVLDESYGDMILYGVSCLI